MLGSDRLLLCAGSRPPRGGRKIGGRDTRHRWRHEYTSKSEEAMDRRMARDPLAQGHRHGQAEAGEKGVRGVSQMAVTLVVRKTTPSRRSLFPLRDQAEGALRLGAFWKLTALGQGGQAGRHISTPLENVDPNAKSPRPRPR